jgi:hypothetical protein
LLGSRNILKAGKLPENDGESHLSGARFVGGFIANTMLSFLFLAIH